MRNPTQAIRRHTTGSQHFTTGFKFLTANPSLNQAEKLLRGVSVLEPARGVPRLPRFACAALHFALSTPALLRYEG